MLKKLFSSFAALLFFAGCSSSGYEPWITRGLNSEPAVSQTYFSIKRTACYGFCPVYTVTVDERDIQEFRGEKFVSEIGGAVGKHLPDGSYKKLVQIAKTHGFEQFDKAYPNEDASNCPLMSTDAPSIIVGFSDAGDVRQVSVYEGCSGFEDHERFNAMVAAMEAVLDIDDLIGPREAFYGSER